MGLLRVEDETAAFLVFLATRGGVSHRGPQRRIEFREWLQAPSESG